MHSGCGCLAGKHREEITGKERPRKWEENIFSTDIFSKRKESEAWQRERYQRGFVVLPKQKPEADSNLLKGCIVCSNPLLPCCPQFFSSIFFFFFVWLALAKQDQNHDVHTSSVTRWIVLFHYNAPLSKQQVIINKQKTHSHLQYNCSMLLM